MPSSATHGLVVLLATIAGLSSLSAEPPLMRDFIGLNGHTVQFRPELYRPVCGLVRDYHPVEWDLGKAPEALPPFPHAKNGVDWRSVYGSWRAAGWNIDVCLMFESIPREDWQDLEPDARAYGEAFARKFGPSGSLRLVDSVEIGNEPGKWNDKDYECMFRAMAAGLRAGDPRLRIATCNLRAGASGKYSKSVSCIEKDLPLCDVLTIHTYAELEGWPTWRRSFPEDPKLPHYLQDVEDLCRWRDDHAPGKPIWITEFGYDACAKPAPPEGTFKKWVGSTETQQAQWLVRSILVFSAMPVERAYVYFFNDNDEPHVHGSSGLTRDFQPKPAFYAMAHLQSVLGGCRFQRVVANEPGRLRIQEYCDGTDLRRVVWAVWSPTGDGRSFTTLIPNVPGRLVDAQRMPLGAGTATLESPPSQTSAGVTVLVDESPIYLCFERP